MGLKTIRIAASLDIVLAVAFIGLQVWYTSEQLHDLGYHPVQPPNPFDDPDISKPVKLYGFNVMPQYFFKADVDKVTTEDNSTNKSSSALDKFFSFTTHVPVQWLLPLLFLMVGMSTISILTSGALVIATNPNYSFRGACAVFSLWVNCYVATFVVTLLVFIVGFRIGVIIVYFILHLSLRGLIVLILTEHFVHLVLAASDIYDGPDGWNVEGKSRNDESTENGDKFTSSLQVSEMPATPTYLVMEFPKI